MTTKEIVRLLGAHRAFEVLADVVPRLSRASCRFMPLDAYMPLRQINISDAMRVYWTELLYRANFAACTAIMRHQRWLDGVITAVANGNFFSFCAALRALMESSADTHHALASVPMTLAENCELIRAAVVGKLQQPVECVLEADLVHFLYGRNTNGQAAPPGHTTLKIAEYLRTVDRDESVGIEECWRCLCQVTHPSAFTVLCFLEEETDGAVRLGQTDDHKSILGFCAQFAPLLAFVVNLPLMQALLTLRVLNGLGCPEVETKGLPSYGLEATEAWKAIEQSLRIH